MVFSGPMLNFILTQQNPKKYDLFCNKSLGGSTRRYLASFQRHFDTLLMSVFVSMTFDGVTWFSSTTTLEMHVNISVTVKTVGGISLFAGRKLGESEGYNYFFVIYYLLELK